MKHTLKIITLLTLGTLSATTMAQAPNTPSTAQANVVTTSNTGTKIETSAVNDYSNIGEGNAYEKAVTPLLREISRKKSMLELKKLDKELNKLDEVEKKDTQAGFVPMPSVQPAMPMQITAPKVIEEISNPVKVLMTYGSDEDLYAKIAVGDQGGYTVRKGDILPDGRAVLKVNSNYIEVQKEVTKKSNSKNKVDKIFVSSGVTVVAPTGQSGQGQTVGGQNFVPAPTSSMPTLMPIPAATVTTGSNQLR